MGRIGDNTNCEIVVTPETIESGFAGRAGACYGFTTPSITGVQVIGPDGDDFALGVTFDDETTAWFHPSLVARLDRESPGSSRRG